jgi:hypothetical protein
MLTPYKKISPERHAENLEIARTAAEMIREADLTIGNSKADELFAQAAAMGDLRTLPRKEYEKAAELYMRALRMRRG